MRVTRICLSGGFGRMGTILWELAQDDPRAEIASIYELDARGLESVYTDLAEALGKNVDVLVMFHNNPKHVVPQARIAMEKKIPVVIGVTGMSEEDISELREIAKTIPVIQASNFSMGVNLLFELAAITAKTLGLDFAVEITEVHHDQKEDSPSGTAITLSERIQEAWGPGEEVNVVHGREGHVGVRPRNEIGMHALRGGDVVGEHTVAFIGQGERIELTHKAHSRKNFGLGAIRAAKWIVGRPVGWFEMGPNVLDLK